MEQSIFVQLSLVIALAAFMSFIMRSLKQPLIIGYILTGILVGPSVLHFIADKKAFESFSEIGIALLLFIIGLGLNAKVIRSLGKVVLLAASLEFLSIGITGYLIMTAFGFGALESLIIGVALTFSSTIIIVKVLSDKKEQTRLYGQIAIGVLLVEDIVATFALLFVTAGAGGGLTLSEVTGLLIKGAILTAFLVIMSIRVFPRLNHMIAGSQEFLFMFAVAWGFGIASLFELAGFSVEVGALFAGVALAGLPYSQEIGARLKPLRDFFIVLFFVVLGESLGLSSLSAALLPAIILSALVLLIKPLFIMTGLGLLGYTKRTSFKAGIHLSQISEFSIVLVVLGVSTGIINPDLSAIITLVAIITIAVSTYLMQYDDKLFAKIEHRLRFFERKVVKPEQKKMNAYPLVLFGYHKGGHEFVKAFKDMHKRFVVVDYNPDVIETLERQGLHYVYGDATDLELLEEIGIEHAKLVVSTITDFSTNVSVARHLHHVNPMVIFVCHADNYEEAAELYRIGVSYVILPHFIGSERISAFIRRHGASKEAFADYRQKHLLSLGRAALR
jgi:Kef-type K+ transport system membrane component KefB/voltage-gated potassium channel Kch